MLKVIPYTYNNRATKELLCLYGTVGCQFRGNRYNIPIEICLQQDHPNVPPLAFVRPTPDMYVAPSSRDVQPDGTVIIPYLKTWRHVKDFLFFLLEVLFDLFCRPHSDLITLLNAMSEAFGQSPPVYAGANATPRQPPPSTYPTNPSLYPTTSSPYPSPYPSNPSPYPSPYPTPYASNPTPYSSHSTPYPTNPSMPMPNVGNPSYAYSQGYSDPAISRDVYRDSIQDAVLNKVRSRVDETLQIGNVEIDSLRKAEQDLMNGEKKVQGLINEAQQQQVQAQVYILFFSLRQFSVFLRIISQIYVQR